jgi:ribosomal-protein-alanine N-acetyltransferase
MTDVATLATARLELIVVARAFLEAVLARSHAAAELLVGVSLPAGWPSDPDTREGLAIHLGELRRNERELPWRLRLIVLREERRAIGGISLKGPPGWDGTVDMGWWLEPEERGRGYATEAARALLAWVRAQPRVRRVTARIHETNHPSMGVARRLGMRVTAERHPEQGVIWEIPVPPVAPREAR